MTVTILVRDIADGKVEIYCDAPPPDTIHNTPCEISRLVGWFMLYAAERILKKSPVKSVSFRRGVEL